MFLHGLRRPTYHTPVNRTKGSPETLVRDARFLLPLVPASRLEAASPLEYLVQIDSRANYWLQVGWPSPTLDAWTRRTQTRSLRQSGPDIYSRPSTKL